MQLATVSRFVLTISLACALYGSASTSIQSSISEPGVSRVYEFLNNGLALTMYKGLRGILYSHSEGNGSLQRLSGVSAACMESFRTLFEGLEANREDAFRFLDSSSKKPTGILTATIGVLGDYDECIEAKFKDISGRHCAIEMAYVAQDNRTVHGSEIEVAFLGDLPIYGYYNHLITICVPDKCTERDMFELSSLVGHLNFEPRDITCDTKTSITFKERFKNGLTIQWLASGYIAFALLIVTVVSIKDRFDGNLRQWETHFSAYRNCSKLFSSRSHHVSYIDWAKFVFMYCIVCVHSYLSLESPVGAYHIRGGSSAMAFTTKLWTQPFVNIECLGLMHFIGGYLIWKMSRDEIATNGIKAALRLLVGRWSRYVLAIVSLIAMDLVWPFIYSGPFLQKKANYLLNNCANRWYQNILFISNFDPPNTCAAHTYFSSLDLQMYFVGLVATLAFTRSSRAGIVVSILSVGLGLVVFWVQNQTDPAPPVLFDFPLTMVKIFGFFEHVLYKPYVNFCYYFAGLFVSIYGSRVKRTNSNKFALLVTFLVSFTVGQYFTAIHTVYGLVAKDQVPLFIIVHKLVWTLAFTAAGLYFTNFWTGNKVKTNNEEGTNDEDNEQGFSFVAGLTRLSFSIYLVNYFVIRTHFFSSRTLLYRDLFSVSKQVMHIHVRTAIVAFVFQILFVMPAEGIRRQLMN